jgi:hypothetical protein
MPETGAPAWLAIATCKAVDLIRTHGKLADIADGDLPARLVLLETALRDVKDELCDVRAQLRDIHERALIMECQLRQPMSIVDRVIGEETARRRYAERFPSPVKPGS